MSKLNGQQKENLKALGIIVKYNRLRKGLSLRELAAKAKMSHTLISNIEKGHISANMNTLNELFRVLQIEFYYDPIVSKEFNELYNKIMTHILNYEYYQARKLLDILEQKSDIYISSPDVINFVIIRCLYYLISNTYIEDKDRTLIEYEVVLDFFTDEQKQLFLFAKGLDYLNKRLYKIADVLFKQALSIGNKEFDCLIKEYRVTSLMRMHKFMDGIEYCKEAITEFETKTIYIRAMRLRLQIAYASIIILKFERANDLVDLVEMYGKKINSTELCEQCNVYRAVLLLKQNRLHEAKQELDKVLQFKDYSYYYLKMRISSFEKDHISYNKIYDEAMTLPILATSYRSIMVFDTIGLFMNEDTDGKTFIAKMNELIDYGMTGNDQELLDAILNILIDYYKNERMYKKAMETAEKLLQIKKFGT